MGNAKKCISPILIALLAVTLIGCPEALGLVDSLQDEPVTISEITVTAPVIGETPVARVAETDQFTGTVTWDPAHDTFAHGHNYSAEISLVPKDGFTLSGVPANFFTVAGADTAHAVNPSIITAIFPVIEAPADDPPTDDPSADDPTANVPPVDEPPADDPPADDAHAVTGRSVIPGVTPPVLGATPVLIIPETDYLIGGNIEWVPDDPTFKADTSYTARISLQPKSRFDMATVPANYFTVAGAEVTHNAEPAVISAVFPKTLIAISGMSPSDEVGNTRPTFTWSGWPRAYRYELQIAKNQEDLKNAPIMTTTTTSYTPSEALTNNHIYNWRVRAVTGSEETTEWSPPYSINIAWGGMSNLRPISGAKVTTTKPIFTWNPVDKAVEYQIRISKNDNLDSAPIIITTDNFFKPTEPLENNEKHYWQSRPVDADGIFGNWSQRRSLNVEWGQISGMSHSNATNIADTRPEFTWNPVSGAYSYEVRISGSPNGLTQDKTVTTSTASYRPDEALTNNQTHYWKVRAVDGDGQRSHWSSTSSVGIGWGAMSGLAPGNATNIADTRPEFTWNPVSGASSYEVRIADSPNGLTQDKTVTTSTASYRPDEALTNNQTHYWKVRAVDADGQMTNWSATFSFHIEWGTNDWKNPVSGTAVSTTRPEFRWSSIPDANRYEIQIGRTVESMKRADSFVVFTNEYVPVDPLENRHTFYWRVRAVDEHGQNSSWSNESRILLQWGRMMTGIFSPDFHVVLPTTRPLFRWDEYDGAIKYQLQIAGHFGNRLSDSVKIETTTNSYQPINALTNFQTHWWRVRPVDIDGQKGIWSHSRNFTIKWGEMSGLMPSSGTVVTDTRPSFSWNPITDAAKYHIRIATTENLDSTAIVETVTNSYIPSEALENHKTHYWQVRPVDYEGMEGNWSALHSFYLEWGEMGGLFPVNGANVEDTRPTLIWSTVSGATSYEIRIADSLNKLTEEKTITTDSNSYQSSAALPNNQTYHWKVRAIDEDGQRTNWSTTNSINIAWGNVDQTEPVDGRVLSTTLPTLSWRSVYGAAKYELQIGTTESAMKLSEPTVIFTNEYTPKFALDNLKMYHWRVRAVDTNGQKGSWTNANRIILQWGNIGGMNPTEGSTLTTTRPTFRWNRHPGALKYQIRLREEHGQFNEDIAFETSTNNYRKISALANFQTYYWQVRSVDAGGQAGQWSIQRRFSVNWGEMTNLSPQSGTVVTNTRPIFGWNNVTDATRYDIRFSTSGNFDAATIFETITNSYVPDVALENSQTHFWQARAVDSDGTVGNWSSARTVTTEWGRVSGMMPADGLVSYNRAPRLTWNSVVGSKSYEIQITANLNEFENAQIIRTGNSINDYSPSDVLGNFRCPDSIRCKYFWRVRAVDVEGQTGPWSEVRSFVIAHELISVSAGGFHTIMLESSGVLWGTGSNNRGQLGDGTREHRSTPVQIVTDVAAVSAGGEHTMILKTDGTLWGTGRNNRGQLGDGTGETRSTPVQIMTDVAAVSAGGSHTMILKTDGTLWGTGWNNRGQLGDGTRTNRLTPVKIMTGVASVSAGTAHTMIIKTDGSLWSTGVNFGGQLGDGTTTNRETPVKIMTDVSDVSAGTAHTMIIKTDGSLWGTGHNFFEELGERRSRDAPQSPSARLLPVKVFDNVTAVSAGNYFTMMIADGGTLISVGDNEFGQLGYWAPWDPTTLTSVKGNVASVSTGLHHTMILMNDGTLWGTGRNVTGTFGDGTLSSSERFVRITW